MSWQNTVKVKKHTPKTNNDSFNNVGVNSLARLVVFGLMTENFSNSMVSTSIQAILLLETHLDVEQLE